jgi:hypothetical protein
MNSTLSLTRLLQTVMELAQEATPAQLKKLGWTQYEIDQAINMGLLELSEGRFKVVE